MTVQLHDVNMVDHSRYFGVMFLAELIMLERVLASSVTLINMTLT
jgi:hypothetical protein